MYILQDMGMGCQWPKQGFDFRCSDFRCFDFRCSDPLSSHSPWRMTRLPPWGPMGVLVLATLVPVVITWSRI